MALNRYSDLTWGKLDLPSLQEQLLVPAMQRQKHDKLLAEQEAIRAGLAKVDPLDVHYEEALKLKRGIEGQLDTTATRLAKEGISPDSTAEAIRLNREYQDLVAPTGRIGQINTAKQIYDTKKAAFLKSAGEQYGTDRAAQLWAQKSQPYTGFDEKQRIANIGDLGIVAKQDYQKDLQTFHSLLGSTMNEVSRGGGGVQYDPVMGGFKTTKSSDASKYKDNLAQLNQMAKSLAGKWINPTGEGYQFNKEAGIDQSNFANRFISDIALQREKARMSATDYDVSFNPDPVGKAPTETAIPTGIADPSSVQEINTEARDTDYSQIGKATGSNDVKTAMEFSMGPSGMSDAEKEKLYAKYDKKQTYTDVIKNPIIQGFYKHTYNDLIKSGKLPKGTDINSPKAAAMIGPIIQASKIPTIGNDVIRPDITPNAAQFAGTLGKKPANERSAAISQEIRNGFRTMIDPVTGEEISGAEARDKGYKFSYIGYESPVNYRGHNFGAKDSESRREQQVMPHKVEVFDKNNNSLGMAEVSRTEQEKATPEYRASYDITQTHRRAVRNMGDWVPVNHSKTGSKALKGDQVKVNPDGTYTIYNHLTKQMTTVNPGGLADYIYSKTLQ